MRKTYLILIGLILSGLKGYSQQYHPMLDSVNNWRYMTTNFLVVSPPPHRHALYPCGYPDYSETERYTTNDTLITGKTYKKLKSLSSGCLYGYMREDTASRKIFFMDNILNPELLLYNFSMGVGDTLTIRFPYSPYYASGVYQVDSILNIHIQAGNRKAFYLSNHASSGKPLVWVESLGNLVDVIYPLTTFQDGGNPYFQNCQGAQHQFIRFLICFDHANKVYYDSCAWQEALHNSCLSVQDTCNYGDICTGIQEMKTLTSLSLYPNPAGSRVTLRIEVTQTDEFELCIRDVSGRQVMEVLPLGKIQPGEQDKEVDVSALDKGMYFLEVRNKTGSTFLKLILK